MIRKKVISCFYKQLNISLKRNLIFCLNSDQWDEVSAIIHGGKLMHARLGMCRPLNLFSFSIFIIFIARANICNHETLWTRLLFPFQHWSSFPMEASRLRGFLLTHKWRGCYRLNESVDKWSYTVYNYLVILIEGLESLCMSLSIMNPSFRWHHSCLLSQSSEPA